MTDEMKPCPVEITDEVKEAVAKAIWRTFQKLDDTAADYVWKALDPTSREVNMKLAQSALTAWNARATAKSDLDAAAKRERERIISALFQEAENTPCEEDAKVFQSCAELIRSDFSYEAAEEYEDALEAAIARAEAAEARATAQSAGGGEIVKVSHCDDGAWMVHTEGDVIAYAGQGDSEAKAHRIAYALNPARAVLTDTAREGEYERGWKEALEACIERVQNANARSGTTGPYGAISLMRDDLEQAIRALPLPTAPSNVGTGETR